MADKLPEAAEKELERFNKLSRQEQAAELMYSEQRDADEAKNRRQLYALYGFNVEASGLRGFTRLPNIIIDNISFFKAINLDTKESLRDKHGNQLYRKTIIDKKTKEQVDQPASLEPLDILVLIHLLSNYQLERNPAFVSCSQSHIAKCFGKSFDAIHRVINKLCDLGYIKKQPYRKGLRTGGHVRQFDIRPFLDQNLKLANLKLRKKQLQESQKLGESFWDQIEDKVLEEPY